MTLLIGMLSNSAVVLTADGRCAKGGGKSVTIVDNLQKIFPLSGLPLAVAHHGQNIINGQDIKAIIADLSCSVGDTILQEGPQRAVCALKEYLNDDARATLSEVGGDTVIGFWVAGFGVQDRSPTLYELCWGSPDEEPAIVRRPSDDHGVVWGGSGECYVGKEDVDACMVSSGSGVGTLKQRCHELYQKAVQRQGNAGGEEFGGYKHQLSVKKTGWHWYIKPCP